MGIQDIYQAVVTYNKAMIGKLVQSEIDKGTDTGEILSKGLIAPLDEIGKKFSDGDLFVPEMLAAAHAVKEALELLRPHLVSAGAKPKGTIIIGTVKGDLHDIGKNIVTMMLEGAGFSVEDLGVDVAAEEFISTAKEKNVDMVAISALLTTTLPAMEETVGLIKKEFAHIKILIGGAPVTNSFAEKVGADGFGMDAPAAVEVARQLLGI